MTIVDRIKKLCENRKITIAELERSAGLTSSTIYRWDKNTPSGDKLEKVADYFNVSVDYLLGRDEAFNEEKEFEAFANDPDLLVWYRNLPEHDADELRRLRALWAIVKDEREKQ
ncbi:helix-turn-helix transcriptional regulator [Listeria booriae]|uniref:Helix-turn-helix transcriptional regulator n=1 Tax=Listeria booriae TaxID=1552123 RepID=A0A842AGN1_9LIST|nr:helix-turn-helix transcriptional regulator [Listeria booriae]MBC1615425.1 helix-turn-helix transcriptional regulator [Listeria booriae]